MVEHPPILKGFCKYTNTLFVKGRPVLRKGEQIPDEEYTRDAHYSYLPVGFLSRSYKKHPHLKFLRKAPVLQAINFLRNMGLTPFRTDPESMPDGKPVDNFVQVMGFFFG